MNYTAESVAHTAERMKKAGVEPRIMIDFSHANSGKDYRRQPIVCHDVARQIAAGDRKIVGVMMESNLVAGAQKLVPGQPLVYGQSITDACIDWAETYALLKELAAAIRGPAAVPAHGGAVEQLRHGRQARLREPAMMVTSAGRRRNQKRCPHHLHLGRRGQRRALRRAADRRAPKAPGRSRPDGQPSSAWAASAWRPPAWSAWSAPKTWR